MENIPIPPGSSLPARQLKIKPDGFLGFMHFLIGGLIIPIILGIILNPIAAALAKNSSTEVYVSFIASLIGIWLGVLVSTKWLLKRYVISNPAKVAGIAAVLYVLVVGFITLVLGSVIAKVGKSDLFLQKDFIINVVLTVVQFVIFYWMSKSYFSKQQSASA